MTDSSEYEIRVHDGIQCGARKRLNTFDSLLIGNTLDCDIYFDNHLASEQRMELLCGIGNITVVLLRGDAMIDGKPMRHGKSYKLLSHQFVKLGATEFSLESVESKVAECSIEENIDNIKVLDANSSSTINSKITVSLVGLLQNPAIILLLIAFAVVGTATAAFNSGSVNPTLQVTEVAAANDIVSELELLDVGAVTIDRISPDNIIVSGVVNNIADQRKLKMAMTQRSEDIVVKTVISDDVVDSVREVFRAYGVQVDISKLKPGRVAVRSETDDLDSLASAETAAKSDVYGLLELNVINNPPEKHKETIAHEQYVESAGQSIRMMIYGDPSYVVTEDQSIFYAGALLPSGHRIKSIQKDTVTLTKAGLDIKLNM